MTFIEFFKQQFIEEAATTRKMLSRVPDNQYNYKPHERSMVMKSLVSHIADLPGWIHLTLTTNELDFQKAYEQPDINNKNELLSYFEKRYNDGLSALVADNEKVLNDPWTLSLSKTSLLNSITRCKKRFLFLIKYSSSCNCPPPSAFFF